MGEMFAPRLSGGIFFALMKEATNPLLSRREYVKSKKEHYSDPNILSRLFSITCDTSLSIYEGDSWKTTTNRYKSCKKEAKGEYIEIEKKENIDAFDRRVMTGYFDVLNEMTEFINEFVDISDNSGKHKKLVQRLLYVIEKDADIANAQEFVFSNGAIKKMDLLSITEVNIYEFLLAVWHFIVTNRSDNTAGQNTYDKWWPHDKLKPRAKRDYNGPGETLLRQNIIVSCDAPEVGQNNQTNNLILPRSAEYVIQNADSNEILRKWSDVKMVRPFPGRMDLASPDKILLAAGVRPCGDTSMYKKDTEAKVGDIIDVGMFIRNLSGQTLNIVIIAALAGRGLQFVEGSTVLRNYLNSGGISIKDITRYTNIGSVEWYNPETEHGPAHGWVEVSYKVRVVSDEFLKEKYALRISNIASGHDKDNNALTSSYTYDVAVIVDYNEGDAQTGES